MTRIPRRVLLVFVDGIGIAPPSPANPFAQVPLVALAPLLDPAAPLPRGGRVAVTDPTLGIPGLPQSATGQTTILTGRNAARVMGRHLHGFPGPTLVALLRASSLFRPLAAAGRPARFLNTFSEPYRSALETTDPERPPSRILGRRLSATTHATLAARIPFCGPEDLLAGRSLFHDFTNETLASRGIDAPRRSPEAAGMLLAEACRPYDLALYEYFLSDVAGHTADLEAGAVQVRRLEGFLAALVDALDDETLLVVTSDHGNLEDARTRSHTLNRVATLLVGPGAETAAARIRGLEDVAPTIHAMLGVRPS